MASSRDKLFAQEGKMPEDFTFGPETAAVFDDMLERSVPMYAELQHHIVEISCFFARPKSTIYDLGCSTGITLQHLAQALPSGNDVRLVGIDSSEAMLEKCRARLQENKIGERVALSKADLNDPLQICDAAVVILNLTLQFVRPLRRDALIQTIYAGLRSGGCLILIEKVLGNDALCNRVFIDLYYAFKKRQGYSEMEIARKREALENVLIPYRLDENKELLARNGFTHVDVFFKWYNFCGMLAIK